jgi:bifunctional DNase/RNase
MSSGDLLPVEVIGVRVEMPSNQPIVLLREVGGIRYLPIWVGAVEASSIAFAQQGVLPPRPMTHDLMKTIIDEMATVLESVHLTQIKDGIFYATLNFAGEKVISARPSDAIALALRMDVPVLATVELIAAVGIEIPDAAEDEVEKFREFLDQINPDDFAG